MLRKASFYWCIKSRFSNQIFLKVGFPGVPGKEMCVSNNVCNSSQRNVLLLVCFLHIYFSLDAAHQGSSLLLYSTKLTFLIHNQIKTILSVCFPHWNTPLNHPYPLFYIYKDLFLHSSLEYWPSFHSKTYLKFIHFDGEKKKWQLLLIFFLRTPITTARESG